MPGVAVLPEGVGYGVTLGIGFFFSLLMIGISWIFNRYSGAKSGSAEEFTSASKSVKPGLIAAGIVSAWTWAATLLQSSAVGYKFGISGPWWYAAGACVQVMLFSMNASKLKKHAPDAHTFLEVIGARWGNVAHLTFLCFGLLTNVIVSSMLILGGSAVVNDISGMPTLAACFLIPVSVCVYVFFGGIRAALFCDYVHTAILLCFILVFMFTAYATSDKIGSPGAMYDLLQKAAERAPVDGNAEGSYLTMRSVNGLIFGVINLIGNFGTVFCDQSYWQRAVASKPSTAVKAFTLGGVSWFAVPFAMATTMGLTAVALTDHPDFPGYPSPLSTLEVTAGLPAPAAASALLGKTGATLMLVVLFLAVVSTSAAEMVAVSNIATFDIYKRYVNPHAEGKQILLVSRGTILAYAIIMGILGTIWYYIGIGMGYLYLLMGCIIGSAVCPVALAIMSTRANKWGCVGGAIGGLFAGLIAWLVTTATLHDGELSIATTGADYPMLAGNLASLGTGVIVSVISTLIWPENCDFTEVSERIRSASGKKGPILVEKGSSMDASARSSESEGEGNGKEDSETPKEPGTAVVREEGAEIVLAGTGESLHDLDKAFRFAAYFSVTLALILLILIPLPLFFTSYIFTKGGFTGWVSVSFIWVFFSICAVVIYPVVESRKALGKIFKAIWADMRGRRPAPEAL